MQLTPEHEALRATIQRFIAEKVNPFVDQWEADEIFPAHQVFKRLGELGLWIGLRDDAAAREQADLTGILVVDLAARLT